MQVKKTKAISFFYLRLNQKGLLSPHHPICFSLATVLFTVQIFKALPIQILCQRLEVCRSLFFLGFSHQWLRYCELPSEPHSTFQPGPITTSQEDHMQLKKISDYSWSLWLVAGLKWPTSSFYYTNQKDFRHSIHLKVKMKALKDRSNFPSFPCSPLWIGSINKSLLL